MNNIPQSLSDRLIEPLSKELSKWIQRKSAQFTSDTLKFTNKIYEQMAVLSVEFGHDIHNDLGIWKSYERLNNQIFGTPLPVHGELYDIDPDDPFDIARVQHFLWKIIGELVPNILISPTHDDLEKLSETVANFLTDKFKRVSKDSIQKEFLTNEMPEAGDAKRKLVWLGTESYFFRLAFFSFIHKNKLKQDVASVDDFICQNITHWSGFGPLDLLAEMLEVSNDLKTDLLSWKERVQGLFKVIQLEQDHLTVLNVFNHCKYEVSTMEASKYFGKAKIIHGWIIPWGGQWYWSGQQQTYKEFTDVELNDFVTTYLSSNPTIQYQFDDAKLEKAREVLVTIYDDSLNFFKNDLGCFANGSEMAVQLKAKDLAVRKIRKPDDKTEEPEYSFPDYIMNCEKGIGYFININEGIELFLGYNDLISGLQKKGESLTEDEEDSFFHFITGTNISPDFVKRVLKDHPADAILQLFFLEELETEHALNYLFRCYKGNYYQKRYPNITIT